MNLSKILPEYKTTHGDLEISNLNFDSRQILPNGLFFCFEGGTVNGHDFAIDAEKNGAVAIVASRQTASQLPHIIVENPRAIIGIAAANFFDNPAKKLKMIGITGTNGKTTTTYIVQSILKAANKKVGVIGTTAILVGDKKIDAKLTTPDPIDFHSILSLMVDSGIEYVVMEVSAHALALFKMEGVVFDVTAFTNLSQDHLDFFGDMETYFAAKAKLFTKKLSKFCVLNADDKWVRRIIKNAEIPFISYGEKAPADIFAIDLKMSTGGLEYVMNINDDIKTVKFNLPGKFNMYNTLCAASICESLGIKHNSIIKGIRNVKKIEGRFQIISTASCSVIVDFAHTDDGLKNILSAIKEFAKGRIISVFGCGGDRDKTKRPLMGKVVSEYSDYCFITSDNPRTEDPLSIMLEIESGISKSKKSKTRLVVDRKMAIKQALEFASDDDIVLIAGKGAENYMEIGDIKIPYNDEDYVLELIEEQERN